MAGLLGNKPKQAPMEQSIPLQKDYGAMLTQSPDELFVQLLEQQDAEQAAKQSALEEAIMQKKEAMRGRVDLSPAAQLIDSSFGTNIAPAFKGDLQAALQDQDNLAELEKELLNSGGSAQNKLLSYAQQQKRAEGFGDKENRIAEQFNRSQVTSAFKDIKSEIGKEREAVAKTATSLDRFDEALNSGNPERINSMLSVLAKDLNREAGALAEGDINRQFLQSYDMKLKSFLAKFDKDQKYSEGDLAQMAQTLSEARGIVSKVSKAKIGGLRATYGGDPSFMQAYQNIQSQPGNVVDATEKLVDDLAVSKYIPPSKRAKTAGAAPSKAQAFRDRLKAGK
jgi:hypothetical protein